MDDEEKRTRKSWKYLVVFGKEVCAIGGRTTMLEHARTTVAVVVVAAAEELVVVAADGPPETGVGWGHP